MRRSMESCLGKEFKGDNATGQENGFCSKGPMTAFLDFSSDKYESMAAGNDDAPW